MPTMTIRNIPDIIHNAIKARARMNNRSAEAEVRALLEKTMLEEPSIKLGDRLHAIFAETGLTEEEYTIICQRSEQTERDLPDFNSAEYGA